MCLPKEPSAKRREDWQRYDWHCSSSVLSMKFSWATSVVPCTETLYSCADTQLQDSWVGSSRHWAPCAQCSLLDHTHLSKYHFSSSTLLKDQANTEVYLQPPQALSVRKAWELTSEHGNSCLVSPKQHHTFPHWHSICKTQQPFSSWISVKTT